MLDRVATMAKWDKRASPKRDQSGDVATGRGVSYCKYELVRTYVATIAEVEVKRSTGEIRVTRFYVAHDCGQIINPDGLKNQIEGGIIQSTSWTLYEQVRFDNPGNNPSTLDRVLTLVTSDGTDPSAPAVASVGKSANVAVDSPSAGSQRNSRPRSVNVSWKRDSRAGVHRNGSICASR